MHIANSTLLLKPGMYILRYPKDGQAPLSITRAPDDGVGRLEIVATPGTHGAILRSGADCIVMHVSEAPVDLLVAAFLPHAGAPAPSLRVDQVALDAAPSALHHPPAVPAAAGLPAVGAGAPIRISDKGVSIIGHIERSGDSVASEGEPLGDPTAALRIEGFQVMWPNRPAGVDLAYGVEAEGVGPTPLVQTGKFCGTRGQALRITEVRFALTGPQACQFTLEGSAWFSGGFRMPIVSGMAVTGPSGLEHLTALSLRTVAVVQPQAGNNPWDASPHTRIFKASTAAPAPAAKVATVSAAKPKRAK